MKAFVSRRGMLNKLQAISIQVWMNQPAANGFRIGNAETVPRKPLQVGDRYHWIIIYIAILNKLMFS